MKLQEAIDACNKIDSQKIENLCNLVRNRDEIIILGNGGSSAIASHISQDYTKKLGKKSFTFSDSSRLTCYINDYGIEVAYKQFLKEFSNQNTLVILISSSGNSSNILNCAEFCVEKNTGFVILTGFDANNKLRSLYSANALEDFWIDSKDYGVVECVHQLILHTPA
jgi:D-sedoheptulose 7-phosphate isomerase